MRDLKTSIRLDIKEAAGQNGAHLTYQGRNLARWTIEFRGGHGLCDAGTAGPLRFTVEDSYAMLCRLAEVAYRASGSVLVDGETMKRVAKPIPVSHPLLALAQINAMLVEEISWPERQDDLSYVMTWSCIQYAPPPPKQEVSYPLEGDVLNAAPQGTFEDKYGLAPASLTSPQLPKPPSKGTVKP
ncbi:MAG: hypothetical protein HYV09_35785 [Deltaproteobacteria bacterium]|nr:hypothetical protein [Deltaproteobacteria bacterium]